MNQENPPFIDQNQNFDLISNQMEEKRRKTIVNKLRRYFCCFLCPYKPRKRRLLRKPIPKQTEYKRPPIKSKPKLPIALPIDVKSALILQRNIRGYLGRIKAKQKLYNALIEIDSYWMKIQDGKEFERQRLAAIKLAREQVSIDFYIDFLLLSYKILIIQ